MEVLGNQIAFREANGENYCYDHNLNSESIVIELGGNSGTWISNIIQKFNPHVYTIEPLQGYYNQLKDRFTNNKVKILKVGIGKENSPGVIYFDDVGSSRHLPNGNGESVEFVTMERLLNLWNLTTVDFLNVNIEGDEYDLLEHMIATGIVSQFKTIQIQFHLIGSDPAGRRARIQQGLAAAGFTQKYNFDFVWEAWSQ